MTTTMMMERRWVVNALLTVRNDDVLCRARMTRRTKTRRKRRMSRAANESPMPSLRLLLRARVKTKELD